MSAQKVGTEHHIEALRGRYQYGLQALLGLPQGIVCGPYVGDAVLMSCICCSTDSVHRMALAASNKRRFASAHQISVGSQLQMSPWRRTDSRHIWMYECMSQLIGEHARVCARCGFTYAL